MTTMIQRLATFFGVVLTLLAVAGAFAAGAMYMQPSDPMAARALGLFPVNLLHNIVHLLSGIWGLTAARTWAASRTFFVWGGVMYTALTVLAFISPTGFGLVPLAGPDIALHGLVAVVMLAIGLTAKPVTSASIA